MIARAALFLLASLTQDPRAAQRSLARADFLGTIAAAEALLQSQPGNQDASALLMLLLSDADPARAARLRRTAIPEPPSLPEIPSDDPPRAAGLAYVDVASARLSAKAGRNARLVARVRVGTEVRVVSIRDGSARLVIDDAGDGPARGYMRADLLSTNAPTVAGFLMKADALKSRGAEFELAMLWRAINLDARRPDVLERLVASAFATRRFGLAVSGARLAVASGRFTLADLDAGFVSAESLRVQLGRDAFAKSGGVTFHLRGITRYVMALVGDQSDGITMTVGDYFSGAGSRSPLWPALQRLLLSSPVVRSDDRWLFDTSGSALELKRTEGRWRVSIFELPGGGAKGETSGTYEWEDRLAAERATRAAAPPRP